MPELDTPLHIKMYQGWRKTYQGWKKRSLRRRLVKAAQIVFGKHDIYGLEWGDPDSSAPLTYIRDQYLLPYIGTETFAIEIGPGGGRWTRYMKGVKKLYAVDYHQELLDELRRTFHWHNISFIKNNGDDFPGIPANSIDLVFSFGVFVHLDVGIIDRYLKNIKPLLRKEANVIIQYSDKTKPLGRLRAGFSQNDPTTMRHLVTDNGYSIYEEDIQTLWNSSVIRFGLRAA
jgi:Methyltransferase domain